MNGHKIIQKRKQNTYLNIDNDDECERRKKKPFSIEIYSVELFVTGTS